MTRTMMRRGNRVSILLISFILSFLCLFSTIPNVQANEVKSLDSLKFSISNDGKIENSLDNKNSQESGIGNTMTNIITKYKTLIMGLSGFGLITLVGAFIFNLTKLGTTAHNPQERSKTIGALIFCAIATIGLGSVMMFVGLFYNMLAS